jgi:hypothetical protein
MVFAKLWLLGILVAVLSVAALPPSSAPIIVNNQVPAQEQAASVPVVQPCPDTTTAQVAAAEERLSGLIERNRQELQTETAQVAVSATELDGRLLQIEERLRLAENQVVERKADVQAMRGALVAPLIMTWVLTGLAAVVAMAAGYGALRALHMKRESRDTTTKP